MQIPSERPPERPPERDTVSVYFVNAALRKLAPPARERLLQALDIPASWLALPGARVPAATFSALWLAVARELDDEFFGLDARRMKVGSFALLCQAVLGCSNLDRAVRRMLRGFALFLDQVQATLWLEPATGRAQLRLNNTLPDADDRLFADETLLVLLHGLMCWLVGQRIAVQALHLAHARPAHAVEYTRMFSPVLVFEAPQTCLCFDAAVLAAPLVQTPASLLQFLRHAPQSVFLKYKNEDSWTARVQRRLRSALLAQQPWPPLEAMAQALGSTPTTFRRRLEAEGSSYQQIKDQLRSDWAIDQLCHSSLSLDELAATLGFHDASAFHRAFRRWNGLSPGAYRRARGAPG